MSKGHDGKISFKKVMDGDIIDFYDCNQNSGDPLEEPAVGMVVDIKYNDHEVSSFTVLPLVASPKNEYIEKGQEFYLVSNSRDIGEDMGLNENMNYRVLYSELTVQPHPEHLGGIGSTNRGVTKHGTLNGTDLFERIIRHRNNGMPQGLGFVNSSNTVEQIETYEMGERGKNMHIERARQDHGNATQVGEFPKLEFPDS